MTNTMSAPPFPHTFDQLIYNVNIATFSKQYGFHANALKQKQASDYHAYGQLHNAALAVTNGKISWIGANDAVPVKQAANLIDGKGKWLLPGFIDCHTHLVYAGNRSNEFEARLQGLSYKEIAENGGGIVATVNATRQASFTELYQQSEKRLQALLSEGLSTIEIKSGYGLDLATERKMLQVARKLGENYPVSVKTTYLAAHALPVEYEGRADEYIDKVCEWMPILQREGLIDAVDGFCENIGFSKAQMAKVFASAKSLGLDVKLHAEQLSDMDGSALVADYHGLSSDHLEHLSEKNVHKLAQSDSVAVLLPGAFYTLRETKLPPIESLRKHQVAIALATDCNPGTSPLTSLLLTLNMGCTLFSLTPEESLAGITVHAAKALGLANKGRIEIGADADLVLWDIARPADLAYLIGYNPAKQVMINGQWLSAITQ